MAVSQSDLAQMRLQNIQALRGLAALAVVLSHLVFVEAKYSTAPILSELFLFGMSGVDLFFVISGFIMVYITQTRQSAQPNNILDFLFARAARIYPLYWVVTLALLLVYLVRPDMVFASSSGEPNILKSFLLWPDERLPLLEVGWTLIHEMSFYLAFALLLFIPTKWRFAGAFFWGVAVYIGLRAGWHEQTNITRILFHPLTFEFLAGAFVAWIMIARPLKFGWVFSTIGAGGLIAAIYIWRNDMMALFDLPWHRVFTLLAPMSFILAAALAFEHRQKIAPRPLVRLGDWSYSLYLTHVLSISLAGRVWALFERPGPIDNAVMLLLMIVFSIVVAGATYRFIEKPMLDAAKRASKKLAARKLP
ncbi:MAG: acyltransferase [Hyphococcus sp.]|nr:MAG: acyltransferase [Marinicaulis sp.]